MKKVILILAVMLLSAGTVMAQEAEGEAETAGEALNVITLDLAPLFRGFALSQRDREWDVNVSTFGFAVEYERAVAPEYTIGGRINFMRNRWRDEDITASVFSLMFIGRWYPRTALDGLFLGVGLGFDRLAVDFGPEDDSWMGLALDLNVGWRHLIGERFFITPAAGYRISKTGGIWAVMFEGLPELFGLSGFYGSLGMGWRF